MTKPKIGPAVAVAALLALTACQTSQQPVVVTTKRVPIDVPVGLFNCPVLKSLPEAESLTERQVAQLIVTLHRNNLTCRNSVDAIRRYVTEVKGRG